MASNSPRPALLPSPLPDDDPSSAPRTVSSSRSPRDRRISPSQLHGAIHRHVHDLVGPEDLVDPVVVTGGEDFDPEYIEPSQEELLPPPNFQPFFTLVEDATAGEHHHPAVHYIFSDDDPELQTLATLRSLGDPQAFQPGWVPQSPGDNPEGQDEGPHEPPLPPPRQGVTEHYILLDLAADGKSVEAVQSLSSNWAVTSTSIRTAPMWGASAPPTASVNADGSETGMMLQITGTSAPAAAGDENKDAELVNDARRAQGGDLIAGLNGLIGAFDTGMGILDKVVGWQEEVVEGQAATQERLHLSPRR